jgi:hypothetical protein
MMTTPSLAISTLMAFRRNSVVKRTLTSPIPLRTSDLIIWELLKITENGAVCLRSTNYSTDSEATSIKTNFPLQQLTILKTKYLGHTKSGAQPASLLGTLWED